MRSLKVDHNNDLILDPSGNLAIVEGEAALIQNTVTAMKAQRGEMPFDMQGGMPTLATAWVDLDSDAFQAAARRVINKVYGVQSIRSFSLTQDGDVLRYAVNIVSDLGEIAVGAEIG